MSTLPVDTRRFRAEREEEWRRLEDIVVRAEKRSVRRLSDDELLALPVLYRGALSSLSVARETSLDLELVTYLESLCARAYFFVYGVRTPVGRRILTFLGRDWPAAIRSLWKETLAALLLIFVGALTGYLLVMSDPSWYEMLMPGEMVQGRGFDSSTEELRRTLYDSDEVDALSVFATFLFTNNAQVAIFCFALGFAFGVPTSLLLVYNGTTLGAFVALFVSKGLGFEVAGWLMIHGTTEFFAIALAGAAGIRIGWAVVFPGEETRLDAATRAGRTAAIAMGGVVTMLFVAGLLEGYGRQLIGVDAARYAVGLGMLALWTGYFYLPRRPPAGGGGHG